MPEASDLIDRLAGIAPGAPLDALRRQRPDVAAHTQGSYDTLIGQPEPGGLSQAERELAALRAAALLKNHPLAQHHQDRLRALGADEALIDAAAQGADPAALPPLTAAILRHVDLLTLTPSRASQAAIDDLQSSGLTTPEIVTLAQLIAFVNFQSRLLTGLRLLGEDQ